MPEKKISRKQVQEVLDELNIENRFSLRTVDFSDLARARPQFVKIKEWDHNGQEREIKDTLHDRLGVIVKFDFVPEEGVIRLG